MQFDKRNESKSMRTHCILSDDVNNLYAIAQVTRIEFEASQLSK